MSRTGSSLMGMEGEITNSKTISGTDEYYERKIQEGRIQCLLGMGQRRMALLRYPSSQDLKDEELAT